MTPTNVVSMNFKDKASLDDFVKMYQKDSPKLYLNAEILIFTKLTYIECHCCFNLPK